MSSTETHMTRMTKMDEMPKRFKQFSKELLSLYHEKAPSGGEEVKMFLKLRDDVRDQAIIYREVILPVAVKVVINISDYFDNYELSFKQWKSYLHYIIEEARKHEAACILLRNMHLDLITTLKRQEKEARIAMEEMKKLSDQLNAKSSSLESAAHREQVGGWIANGLGLLFAVPTLGISLIVGTATNIGLQIGAIEDHAKAIAAKTNADINNKAAESAEENIIQAIENFVTGLNEWQGFFNKTIMDLTKFKDGALKGENATDPIEMEMYYEKTRLVTKAIDRSCKDFMGSIGDVSIFYSHSILNSQ
jgi:hypothetical protein